MTLDELRALLIDIRKRGLKRPTSYDYATCHDSDDTRSLEIDDAEADALENQIDAAIAALDG